MDVRKVEAFTQVLQTHSGRDKVAKFFHYISRILVWYYYRKGNPNRAGEIENFRQAIGTARRVGRFFSSISSALDIYGLSSDPSPPHVRFALLIAYLCDFFYFFSDNLTFFSKYGFKRLTPSQVEFWDNTVGSWSWLIAMIIYIYVDVREMRIASSRRKSTVEELREYKEYIYNKKIDMVCNLCDLMLAIYFCFPERSFSSQTVGVFGVLSAIFGFFKMYRSNLRKIKAQ